MSEKNSERVKVTCNKCDASLMAPRRAVGKRVKCPKCRAILTVPDPGSTVDRMLFALGDEESNSPALDTQPPLPEPVVTEQGTKLCPRCNAELKPEAVFCTRCGFHLTRRLTASEGLTGVENKPIRKILAKLFKGKK